MKNTSRKFAALILALVLTLSLALAAPAASAATADLAETSAQGDDIDNPKPITLGKAERIVLTEGQTFFYSFTLNASGVVMLNPTFDCTDAHQFYFEFQNAADHNEVSHKYIYGNQNKAFDFYLAKGNYILSVRKNTGADIDTVTTLLYYHQVTGLKASAAGNSVTLKWNKVDNVRSYQVNFKPANSNKWRAFATTENNYCKVTKLLPVTKYDFAVRANFKEGTGKWKYISCTTKLLATPAAPTLKKTASGIQISWKRVDGAANYRIFRKEGNGGWKKIADTNKAYVDKKVKNGTRYTYTIRCISADGKTYTSKYNQTGSSILYRR